MELKSYIAVFFAVIFFGKFVMMDAKFLEMVIDSAEVTYVNPYCEKNSAQVNEAGVPQDILPSSKFQSMSFDSFCNVPFHFELVRWENLMVQVTYQHYTYTTPGPTKIFRKNFYPPPQV